LFSILSKYCVSSFGTSKVQLHYFIFHKAVQMYTYYENHIKAEKLKDNISLFIEYYNGSTINSDGKRVHNRRQEYLKRYLHFTPSTSKEKNENKENLELAENIYSIRKAEYLQGKFKSQDKSKSKQCSLPLRLILKIN